MHAKRLDELRRRMSAGGVFGPFRRRRAADLLLSRGTPAAIRHAVRGAIETPDDALRTHVLERLRATTDPDRIDEVCAAWADTRHPDLDKLLAERGWVASAPPALHVLTALKAGRADGARDGGAGVVAPLLAAARDVEAHVATAARAALADLRQAAARDALCDAAIDDGDEVAATAATAAGHVPSDPHRRAVFLFLTGQWAAYESLDFDGASLRAAYEVAPAGLRARLAAAARRAGRVEFVAVASGGRQGRRLGEMTDAEWEAAVAVLVGGNRGDELWQLAQAAPPRWGARILRRLAAAGWSPPPGTDDAAAFASLVALAAAWVDPESAPARASQVKLDGHGRPVVALAFTPDGKLLVSLGEDRTLRVWSLPDGWALVRQTGQAPTCMAVSPDGRHLATAGADGSIRLWSLPDGRQRERLAGHVAPVARLGVFPDGHTLASAGADGTVRLWALPGGLELRTLKPAGDAFLAARAAAAPDGLLAVARDSALMASAARGDDGHVLLWSRVDRGGNTSAGATAASLAFREHGATPPGSRLADAATSAAGSDDDDDDATAADSSAPRAWANRPVLGKGFAVRALSLPPAPPGGGRLVAGGDGGNLVLWHVANASAVALVGHAAAVTSLAASGEGRLLASGDAGGVVRLWSLPDGSPLQAWHGHAGPVRCLAFSHARGVLASGGADGVIHVWGAQALRLSRLPVVRMTLLDLEWATATLAEALVTPAERAALELIVELLRRRHRHDVIVTDATGRVTAGEFDIEIG